MTLDRKSASALVEGSGVPQKTAVRMLKATHVQGYGDTEIGDEVAVSTTDAQFLIGYKYAELID